MHSKKGEITKHNIIGALNITFKQNHRMFMQNLEQSLLAQLLAAFQEGF